MKKLLYAKPIFGRSEIEAVNKVLQTSQLSGGEQTIRFEEELARWWGVKYAISCNSGSAANFIALASLELPKDSEVITPAGGAFPTTISPIVYLGLVPRFVDIDLDTWAMDLFQITVSKKTKAIMFAHLLGFMPQMKPLVVYANYHKIWIIEDCCDAMGSEQYGQKVGTFGDLATVSFYPAHLMTTGGEGGAVLTNNEELYWKCRSIRDWGRDCRCRATYPQPACGNRFRHASFDHRYYYTSLGLNFKMTEMQAAFGRKQLKRVNDFIYKRKRNYNILAEKLGREKVSDIVPFAFPILHPRRQEVMTELERKGIETRAIFSGNILAHPAYKNIKYKKVGELKNSERMLKEGFFVGIGPHLTVENMEYIAKEVDKTLKK